MRAPVPAPDRDARVDTPPARMLLAVWAIALLVRLLHNEAMAADPLHWVPLGGNLPLLLAAEAIAGGDLLPFDGPISLNSPLYPYILAALYEGLGVNAFHAVRMVASAVDAGTCALVATLAFRHFGTVAGWAAGLSLAFFGPMIFFATDLNPVPWTLFLLTGAVALLDGPLRGRRTAAAGLLLGLAAGTRPNVLLGAAPALLVPWARRAPRPWRLAGALAVGVGLGVAPVTGLNLAASGEPVLLTVSGGHNFYIGHNPEAEPQYALPRSLDGDIFASMKGLAEEVTGREMADTEVSGWYLRRGLAWIAENPVDEASLLARRALLLLNDHEATTYASYDYQRAWSPLLRWAPTTAWLLLLAAPGALLALHRERLHLWIPFLTAAATVLLFFYIARLRVVMVPTLGLFAGAAVGRAVELVRSGGWRRAWPPVAVAACIGMVAAGVSSLPLLAPDTSNEWNKAGGVLREAGFHAEAEDALLRAVEANPANPNGWRNLAVLYRETGRPERADDAEARARALSAGDPAAADDFRRGLRGGG